MVAVAMLVQELSEPVTVNVVTGCHTLTFTLGPLKMAGPPEKLQVKEFAVPEALRLAA
jgi:hypothetical protein